MSSENRPNLRVFMLGRFAVERDGRTIPQTAWKRKRPIELLTALVLANGGALHREEIIDRLWPDKDLGAGANNLYRALHDLCRIVGDQAVSVERGVVRLTENVWTDVGAFEAAASAGDPESLATAVELYDGDLLPDDPYSEALGAPRAFLRQRFVDVALRLARAPEDGDSDRKIETLRRLLAVVDPRARRCFAGRAGVRRPLR